VKRSAPLERRTPLRAKEALRRFKRIGPVSEKQRRRREARARQRAAEGRAFRLAIVGRVCIVCGRDEWDAFAATGHGHQSHHGIRQQVLRRLGVDALMFAPRLAICVCEEPCHRQHTTRKRRILRAELPADFVRWCEENGLVRELEREYPV
jgi:hypothetical protein